MILPYFPRYWKKMVLALVCMLLTAITNASTLTVVEMVFDELFPDSSRFAGVIKNDAEREIDPAEESNRVIARLQQRFSRLFEQWQNWVVGQFIMPYRGAPYKVLIVLAVLIIVLTTAKGLFDFGGAYLSAYVTQGFLRDFREDLFAHISGLSLDYFSEKGTGSILARIINDVELLGHSLILWGRLFAEPLTILGLLAVAMGCHVKLTLIAILVFPFAGIIMAQIGRKVHRARKRAQSRLGEISKRLTESITSMRVVQSFGAEEYEQRKFAERTQRLFREALRIARSRNAAGPIMESLGSLGVAAILLLGGYYVFEVGSLESSKFVALVIAIGLVYQPIKRLSKAYNEFQQGVAAADRVLEVYDILPRVKDRPDAESIDSFQKQIEFDQVSFSYDSGETYALRDVNLLVPKGQRVALVGPSGAGKSTLVDLLARFYDVDDGAIRIDGKDVREISIRSLRSLIAFVPQDVMLFNDTIAANIAYSRPDASQEEIVEAARQAYAHDFISQMPQGYETVIGERGAALSGGQCQRLAIARALLKKAPILILDEATSALDTESEKVVQKALENLMENHTTFIIAHRLSTVRHADNIVVLDKGRAVGQGTHKELLASNELYAKLHRLQYFDEAG